MRGENALGVGEFFCLLREGGIQIDNVSASRSVCHPKYPGRQDNQENFEPRRLRGEPFGKVADEAEFVNTGEGSDGGLYFVHYVWL